MKDTFFLQIFKNLRSERSFARSKFFFTETAITWVPCNRFSSNWARLKGQKNLYLFIALCYSFVFVDFIARAIKVSKLSLRS